MATRKNPIILDEAAESVGGASPVDPPAIFDAPSAAPDEPPAPQKMSGASRFLLWSAGGLASALLINAVWGFVLDMMARGTIWGQVALAIVGLFFVAVIVFAISEWRAYARLSRMTALQAEAQSALTAQNLAQLSALIPKLRALYRDRMGVQGAADHRLQSVEDVLDADLRMGVIETAFLEGLDAQARAEVAQATRRVASVTALVPMGSLDMVISFWINLRMIRRVAEIYGGRAGTFGAMRLARSAIAQLVATGAIAIGDDLLSSTLGGSLAGKLSRRFGEGVFNGAMTARLGVIAMQLCRPLPFHALPRPALRSVLSEAFSGLFTGSKG